MRATGLKEGLPGVGWGCRTSFPATSAHEGAILGGGKEFDRPPFVPIVTGDVIYLLLPGKTAKIFQLNKSK